MSLSDSCIKNEITPRNSRGTRSILRKRSLSCNLELLFSAAHNGNQALLTQICPFPLPSIISNHSPTTVFFVEQLNIETIITGVGGGGGGVDQRKRHLKKKIICANNRAVYDL